MTPGLYMDGFMSGLFLGSLLQMLVTWLALGLIAWLRARGALGQHGDE